MAQTITVGRLRVPVIGDPRPLKSALNQALGFARTFSRLLRSAVKVAAIGLGAVTAAATAAGLGLRKLAIEAQPLPGIMRAFEIQAQRSGLSLDALRDAAQGTITDMELMRQANIALTGAGDELAKAFGKELPTLLMGARAAAQAQGKSVEYMFDSIVSGVKRATPLLIDNTGLVLKLGEVNQKWADAAGISVEQMMAQQKSLAILEATTKAANRLIDEMGGLTLTSAQRADRVAISFQNWAHQAGLALLPAMDSINDNLYRLINDIGPKVVNLFQTRIGPGIAALADIFTDMSTKAVETGTNLVNKYGKKLADFAYRALKWGIEVSSQFAIGLIRGASTAIVQAMKFIGSLLTFWMGPGSPPRIAPNIDKYGLNAAAEFLQGFAEADFDLLEGFQSKLQSALGALVGAGSLVAKDSEGLFRDLSMQVTRAVDAFRESGKVPVELFTRLERTGGRLGVELADLARLQFKLAAATDRYRQAEERLKAVQEAREDAQTDLDRIMREYNKMLEAGAPKAELAAKRAEFLAAKKRLDVAEDEIFAAEEKKDAAEDALDPLQKQLKLQERLVEQLASMIDAQKQVAKEIAKAAEVGGIGAEAVAPAIAAPDTSPLENAFNEAKDRIKAALEEAFSPLARVFDELDVAYVKVHTAWEGLQADFDRFWNHPTVVAVREWFKKLFPNMTLQRLALLAGAIVGISAVLVPLITTVGLLTAGLVLMVNPLTGLVAVILVLTRLWYAHGETVKRTVGEMGQAIKTWWDDDVKWRLERLQEWLAEKIPGALTTLINLFVPAALTMSGSVQDVLNVVNSLWEGLKNLWAWLRDNVLKIQIKLPEVPEWAKAWIKTESPKLAIHHAYERLWRDLDKQSMNLGPSMMAMATAGARNIDQSRTTTNYNQLTVHTRATTGTYLADYHTAAGMAR